MDEKKIRTRQSLDDLENGNATLAANASKKTSTHNREAKEKAAKFINENIDQFIEDYKSLEDPQQRCDIFLKMMPYAVPKMSTADISASFEPESISDEIAKLARTIPTATE